FFNFFFSGLFRLRMGDCVLGNGDWVLGIGDWGLPIPKSQPHTRYPIPHTRMDFHALEHGRKGAEEPAAPSVEIMLFQQRQGEDSRFEDAAEVRQREARAVAARLAKSVRDGEIAVYDPAISGHASRVVAYGDVAVLSRTRASYEAYAQAFADIGVPFCTVGGQSFYDKQEITDSINLLTIVDNPFRDIALVAVLRSPFVGVRDDTLLHLGHHGGASVSGERSTDKRAGSQTSNGMPPFTHPYVLAALQEVDSIPDIPTDEKRKLLHFRDILESLRRGKDSMPLHSLAKAALDSTPYLTRILASPGGAQKAANVSKFLNLLREYDARQTGGIGGFLRFYEVMRHYGPREEEAALESFSGNVLKLMTIHAAKGLEFPVVIVADMSRRFNFDRDKFLVSREMEIGCNLWQESSPESSGRRLIFEERREKQVAEEKRLFYVAATRARDHLILAGSYRPEKECDIDSASCPMDWLMAIVGKEAALPEAGDSCEVRLGEARVRLFVDAVEEKPVHADAGISLMERHLARIAAGESIPVAPASAEKLLPEVKKVLERITSRAAAEPDASPAEISASQMMQFQECPYKFFLGELMNFPEREVMTDLGLCPVSKAGGEKTSPQAEAEPPVGMSRRMFGNLVHQCLEQLDFRVGEQEDLKVVTTRFFSSLKYARQAEGLIRYFLRSEEGKRLRKARKVHRELPVKVALDNVILSGVIDVLYLDEEDHWTILDFKTGSEQAENSSQHGGYEFQMLFYAFLVGEATGLRPEKAVIHFLRSGASHLVSTKAEDVERTREKVVEIIAAIGRREFRKKSGVQCRECEYAAVCGPQDDT
ncbi:PD-(D/E)XK nuclease family protein, partial [bacterium]|nr:PD-(D/E)XK nuclease family protein [bacterium]